MINNLPIKSDETEISTKQRNRIRAVSFGLVALAEPSYYSLPDPDLLVPDLEEEKRCKEANLLQEMPVSIREFLESLRVYMNELFSNVCKVKNILAGHEHGEDLGKAHFQCLVDMTSSTNFTPKPASIMVGDVKILIIMQPCNNRKGLEIYCKKENKFEWLNESKVEYIYKKNKAGEDTDKIDAFGTIVRNRDTIGEEAATDLCLSHESRSYFMGCKNVQTAIQSIVKSDRIPFEWTWPDHMTKEEYPTIHKWFHSYCLDNPDRRKALLLYSEERGTGKTRFAKSLVNDPGYYAYYRSTIFKQPTGKDPRMLILDDMSYTGGEDKKEMWKALVAGEDVTIREAYAHWDWDYRVPCIITTNNRKFVQYLASSTDFKTQIVFYEVKGYMGPPGSRPEAIDKVEFDMSDGLVAEIKAHEANMAKNKAEKAERSEEAKKKDFEHFQEMSQLKQQNTDLKFLVQSLQKKLQEKEEKELKKQKQN